MIKYTIISGTPTPEEVQALELALAHHKKNEEVEIVHRSKWGRPIMRTPLNRNN